MKKQFIVSFVLMLGIGQNAFSQTVIPHDIPCFDITPDNVDTLPSGIHALDCITADGATIDFNADQNYSIRAGEYIQFDENTVIEPDSTFLFHAYIQKEDLDLAWYYPNATPGTVGRYEKLELGVHFTDSTIQNKIQIFVKNQPGDKLNPFNPEEIDLYAEFWVLVGDPLGGGESWVGPKRVNGFYYEEYSRGLESWDTIANEDNFRIRYAPPATGTWRCKVSAVVAGYGTLTVSEFTFDCVPSDNKGFVRVGDNKNYLRVGSEPYFPVGQNLTGPNRPSLDIEWDSVPAKPALYTLFHSKMTELADNGANYFRYIVSPWQSEIEFEHLGNYANRMTNAWEFDRILDTAKALDLKLHYNMAMHYSFESPSGFAMTFWDWSAKGDSLTATTGANSICWLDSDVGYCYRNELDMPEVLDFLTDSTAMSYYKKRLRYMVARWGYSTEIAVMELLSEANNFGNTFIVEHVPEAGGCKGGQPDPDGKARNVYEETPWLIAENLCNWQIEMCRYIKQDLGHYEHPLAVDYTGTPEGDLPVPDYVAGDHTFLSAYTDITNFNYYGLAVNKAETNYWFVKAHRARFATFSIDKPIMNPEYGTNAETWKCDHNAGFIHRVCLTPFTGTAGSAMTWDNHMNETNAWQYLGPVKDFMKGVPLDAENWKVMEPMIQNDKSVEVLYLRKTPYSERSKIIGAISNRTFNYYTAGDTVDGCTVIPGDDYGIERDFVYSDLDEDDLTFNYMGSNKAYFITWYNAITGDSIGTWGYSSTILGKFKLEFPGVLSHDSTSPILFFQIYRADEPFLAPIVPDDEATHFPFEFRADSLVEPIEKTNWESLKKKDNVKTALISVSPNPTTNVVHVTIKELDFTTLSWVLTDSKGDIIQGDEVSSSKFTLDLSSYNNGIYYLSFITQSFDHIDPQAHDLMEVFKIIKQ